MHTVCDFAVCTTLFDVAKLTAALRKKMEHPHIPWNVGHFKGPSKTKPSYLDVPGGL